MFSIENSSHDPRINFRLRRRLIGNLDIYIGAILFGLLVFVAYPGFMSPDSIAQLEQAQSGLYTDLHPPMMSFVWRMTNVIQFGPSGMLVLQTTMFLLGLLLSVRYVFRSPVVRSAALAVLFLFPPLFSQVPVIWKDVGLAGSFLLGSSILLHAEKRPWLTLLALPVLFYGTAVRHNAVVALAPLTFWLGWIVTRKRWFPSAVIGVVLTGIFYGGFLLFTAILVGPRHTYFIQNLQGFDLGGISVGIQKVVVPESTLSIGELTRRYNPSYANYLGDLGLSVATGNDEFQKKMSSEWCRQIVINKRAYLHHRWAAYKCLLGLGTAEVYLPCFTAIVGNPWHFEVQHPSAVQLFFAPTYFLRNSVFFRGYIYLGLAFLLTLTIFSHLRSVPLFCLASSGLLYGATYFLVCYCADLKYLYWTIDSSLIALLLLSGSIARSRSVLLARDPKIGE